MLLLVIPQRIFSEWKPLASPYYFIIHTRNLVRANKSRHLRRFFRRRITGSSNKSFCSCASDFPLSPRACTSWDLFKNENSWATVDIFTFERRSQSSITSCDGCARFQFMRHIRWDIPKKSGRKLTARYFLLEVCTRGEFAVCGKEGRSGEKNPSRWKMMRGKIFSVGNENEHDNTRRYERIFNWTNW